MEIYEIAKKIASHLDGWAAMAGSKDRRVSLVHVRAGVIFVTEYQGKLNFWASFPRLKYSYSTALTGKSSINISQDKSSATIAKSLKKRLLDEYVKALEVVNQEIGDRKVKEKAAQALALECKSILGANAYCNNDWGTSNIYTIIRARYNQASTTDVGVKIEIANYYAGEKGNIKIDDLPKDMLLRILKILQ